MNHNLHHLVKNVILAGNGTKKNLPSWWGSNFRDAKTVICLMLVSWDLKPPNMVAHRSTYPEYRSDYLECNIYPVHV